MSSYLGSNGTFEGMKNLNIEKIYRMILLNQPVSRAQLAKLASSNKVTVSNCVEFLMEHGIVRETGVAGSSKGRPPIMLSINGESGVYIGIEMSILSTRVLTTDLAGEILDNIILPDAGLRPEASIQQISESIELIKKKYKRRKLGVVGVGIAFPGHYNQQTGVIELLINRQTWNKFPVREELQRRRLGVPIFIQSTTQAGTMGEIHYGKANPDEHLVCISGTWGIGAGMYSNGALIFGSQGFAGRFGHTVIQVNGKQCVCGNKGCLEEYASIRALYSKLYPGKAQLQKYILEIFERVRMKEPAAMEALNEIMQYLEVGIINIINTFNPTSICISGYLGSIIDQEMLEELKSSVSRMLPEHYCRNLDIHCSILGELGAPYGCIAIVREELIGILNDSAEKEQNSRDLA